MSPGLRLSARMRRGTRSTSSTPTVAACSRRASPGTRSIFDPTSSNWPSGVLMEPCTRPMWMGPASCRLARSARAPNGPPMAVGFCSSPLVRVKCATGLPAGAVSCQWSTRTARIRAASEWLRPTQTGRLPATGRSLRRSPTGWGRRASCLSSAPTDPAWSRWGSRGTIRGGLPRGPGLHSSPPAPRVPQFPSPSLGRREA